MSQGLIVVCDACVLYPMILRDLLLRLAAAELFSAKWTQQIHEEWIRNLLKSRPDLTLTKLNNLRKLIDQSTPDCIVENYEHLIQDINLPDPDDRHVLAAAIIAQASLIITFNLKDFPATILEQYQIEACHPDDFIIRLADTNLDAVLNAVNLARTSLKRPPIDITEYFGILEKHSLQKTIVLLQEYIQVL